MIEVLDAGPLTTVQDSTGRAGFRHLGVPVCGAADPWSARLANRLVGNPADAAFLEMSIGGGILRFSGAITIALTGGLSGTVDGLELRSDAAREVRAGATVRAVEGRGARGYLAVAGGIAVEPILGSRSTDLRGHFGGLDGRALRAGDRLRTGTANPAASAWTGRWATGPIRIVDGPHGAATELAGGWVVGTEADRAGLRLDGRSVDGGTVASMGLPLGAVQVPPDGRPIVMLADRPVTGGYRVPACVIRADIGRVAQLRAGEPFTFAPVTLDHAHAALEDAETELAAVEPLGGIGDDDLGWTGSHD